LRGTPDEVFSKREELRAIDLDIPFVLKMKEALEQAGIDVGEAKTIKQLSRPMPIKFTDVSYVYSPKTPFQYEALRHINLDIKDGHSRPSSAIPAAANRP
jgi:hypothetical protein